MPEVDANTGSEKILSLSPWSEEQLTSGEKYEWIWNYELNAKTVEIWPLLIDTSKFNRLVGYSEAEYEERGGLMYGSSGEGDSREEWVDFDWEWEYPKFISRTRKYIKGFIKYNKMILGLEDRANSLLISVYHGNISDNKLAKRYLPRYVEPFQEKYGRAFLELERAINEKSRTVFSPRTLRIDESIDRLIADRKDRLLKAGQPKEIVERITDFIRSADTGDLYRIRPLELSAAWGLPGAAVVRVFLFGVREGLFNLTWDVLCPHCRGVRQALPSLAMLPLKSRCDACDLDFQTNQENSIEVTFHLHPSISKVQRAWYCSAEPGRRSHILIQKSIPPGKRTFFFPVPDAIPTEDIAKDFRIRFKGSPEGIPFEAKSARDNILFEFVHTGSDRATAILETSVWAKGTLKPGFIFNMQEFRDLFSSEHLSTELQLDIGEQTIVFTDIVGSTGFYERSGDAAAFHEIQKAFQFIFKQTLSCEGSVVKTIGDGAMLSFSDPTMAMKVILSTLENFPVLESGPRPLSIRLSAHTGRCLAVNFNTGIDYFGQTVNFASKLQSGAGPNQAVLSETFWNAPGIQHLILPGRFATEKVELRVAGVTSILNGIRISTHSSVDHRLRQHWEM